jgi:hypothetical protein
MKLSLAEKNIVNNLVLIYSSVSSSPAPSAPSQPTTTTQMKLSLAEKYYNIILFDSLFKV